MTRVGESYRVIYTLEIMQLAIERCIRGTSYLFKLTQIEICVRYSLCSEITR